MILERIKQGYRNIPRKFGVHGSISLNHESIGGKVTIYTLESLWDTNKDEQAGIVGKSCVAPGIYELHIEESPVTGREYPFLVNESLGVALKTKTTATGRTGHCFSDIDLDDPTQIYGRFIMCGTSTKWRSKGFYLPQDQETAVSILNTYIRESGDTSLRIRWRT